ncbi:plcA: 1-phosphatidylinositol phosphodiesterase [Crotalus adamanteus]|uniref:PlcA: 1-phosphatidylinositol phosphodiesterase n=1 Tax=Crotalus adamanteus TaxID=8729 RepID=A0AAW1BZD2_CROAD
MFWPASYLSDWMSGLPDHLSLSKISIPGTHDSMSVLGGPKICCQTWPLEAQLAAGVRFLDIRCKLENGLFLIYHVNTFQEADFSDVLEGILSFLNQHPGEEVHGVSYEELSVSDVWHVFCPECKWEQVKEHLDLATTGDPNVLHLTFCSGNGLFTNPEKLARDINPRCHQYLKSQAGPALCWGVVILDFPGTGLIQTIVESNFGTQHYDDVTI